MPSFSFSFSLLLCPSLRRTTSLPPPVAALRIPRPLYPTSLICPVTRCHLWTSSINRASCPSTWPTTSTNTHTSTSTTSNLSPPQTTSLPLLPSLDPSLFPSPDSAENAPQASSSAFRTPTKSSPPGTRSTSQSTTESPSPVNGNHLQVKIRKAHSPFPFPSSPPCAYAQTSTEIMFFFVLFPPTRRHAQSNNRHTSPLFSLSLFALRTYTSLVLEPRTGVGTRQKRLHGINCSKSTLYRFSPPYDSALRWLGIPAAEHCGLKIYFRCLHLLLAQCLHASVIMGNSASTKSLPVSMERIAYAHPPALVSTATINT